MQPTNSTTLDLNAAFHRYNALGVIRHVRPRARVCIQGVSTQVAKVLLLVDYTTSYWDPKLAGVYAVAASFVLDGVSARAYEKAVQGAIRKHGRGQDGKSYRSELQALCDMLATHQAVCIQRDDILLGMLSEAENHPVASLPAVLNAVAAAVLYEGEEDISAIKGIVAPAQVEALVQQTLAVGLTAFTEERFQREAAAGQHGNWRFENSRHAA